MRKYLLTSFFCAVFLLLGILGITKTSLATDGTWSAVSAGMNGGINSLAVYNSELYAGGSFTTAGGTTTNYIAKWNGSSWSAVGSGVNGEVNSLAVYNNALYVTGSFTSAGGSSAVRIAKWDGSSWSALGLGIGGEGYSLAVYNNELYVGGNFTSAGGLVRNYIAKWNGSTWSKAYDIVEPNSTVNALTVYNSELYVGGAFSNIGANISKLTVTGWQALSSGTNASVLSLTSYNSNVYAGGNFTTAGGTATNYIAKWTEATPTPAPTVVEIQQQNLVDGKKVKLKKALKKQTISGQDLKLNFKKLPTKLTKGSKYYMKWNKNEKYPKNVIKVKKMAMKKVWNLKTDLKKYKAKKKKDNYKIKVTFQYTDAEFEAMKKKNKKLKEEELALYAKKKRDTEWRIASEMYSNADVEHDAENNAFIFYTTNLLTSTLLTSTVTSSDPLTANFDFMIADAGWEPMGSGINNGTIKDMQFYKGNWYVGGHFNIGGEYNLAKWEHGTWTAVGGGIGARFGVVNALEVYRNELYVGGTYYNDQGNEADYGNLRIWDGRRWKRGDILRIIKGRPRSQPSVTSMLVHNNELYVGFAESCVRRGTPHHFEVENSPVAAWNGASYSWRTFPVRVDLCRGSLGRPDLVQVGSIQFYQDQLYMIGNFAFVHYRGDNIGNAYYTMGIAKWGGTDLGHIGWESVGTLNDSPFTNTNHIDPNTHIDSPLATVAAVWQNRLYVASSNLNNGVRMHSFDGSNWEEAGGLGLNDNNIIRSMLVDKWDGNLYLAGDGFFGKLQEFWDYEFLFDWPGMTRFNVINQSLSGLYIYAGGNFTDVGGLPANRIARKNLSR